MTKFISKVDGKVFSNKEDLMNYLEKEYVQVEESNENSTYAHIISKLKESFSQI